MSNPLVVKQVRRILLLGKDESYTEHIFNILTARSKKSNTELSQSDQPAYTIKTPYYTAEVPVWRDEVSSAEVWAEQWHGEDGASDVVRAIGSWVVCFAKPSNEDGKQAVRTLLTKVSETIAHHLKAASPYALDYLDMSDVLLLAVAVPQPGGQIVDSEPSLSSSLSTPAAAQVEAELEELCQTAIGASGSISGWEYVDGTIPLGSVKKNEYGERVGLDRLFEALASGEWDAGADKPDDVLEDGSEEAVTGDDLGGFQRLDEDEDEDGGDEVDDGSGSDEDHDDFGAFAHAPSQQDVDAIKQEGSKVGFEDDFGSEMAAGFGELMLAAQSSRMPMSAEENYHEDEERAAAAEMNASLLSNAQTPGQQSGEGTIGNGRRAGQGDTMSPLAHLDQFASSGNAEDDDPWRVRGKGPSGPPTTSLLERGTAADEKLSESGAPRSEKRGIHNQGIISPSLGLSLGDNENDDDDDDAAAVEQLQSMILRLQAARDLGADLPAAQRRELAARAVAEVMRDM